MRKCTDNQIKPSDITEENIFRRRREFLRLAGMGAVSAIATSACGESQETAAPDVATMRSYGELSKSQYSTHETPNAYEDVTTYNNYYEFGTEKQDPHRNAQELVTRPWTVSVSGECDKPGEYHYEDLIKRNQLEERIYRLRCVEAWSMVIPWVGIPLSTLLNRFEPNSKAKYVVFKTLHDPDQMPGQRRRTLEWPYVEGLTIDEAMNPLSLMVVGVYGRELPNQNGAPMRLMVPWKYGFKSAKSINQIVFTDRRPKTTWAIAGPNEYGFYANVNPGVSHPRWSQAKERKIGAGLFAEKQPTLMFNGYTEHVAHLYTGLDLRTNF